jgi:predicted transcriptional regulator
VSNNATPAEGLPALIQSIFKTLGGAEVGADVAERTPEPAVPVKRSVFPDHLICLEDGKKLKMLKRHLATVYQMTPEQYRERWGLPASYPMVAPDYAARRSVLAKKLGLGRNRQAEPLVTKIPERGRRGKRAS